jgi:hypothetical protein
MVQRKAVLMVSHRYRALQRKPLPSDDEPSQAQISLSVCENGPRLASRVDW